MGECFSLETLVLEVLWVVTHGIPRQQWCSMGKLRGHCPGRKIIRCKSICTPKNWGGLSWPQHTSSNVCQGQESFHVSPTGFNWSRGRCAAAPSLRTTKALSLEEGKGMPRLGELQYVSLRLQLKLREMCWSSASATDTRMRSVKMSWPGGSTCALPPVWAKHAMPLPGSGVAMGVVGVGCPRCHP